jgi:hypothetical protein
MFADYLPSRPSKRGVIYGVLHYNCFLQPSCKQFPQGQDVGTIKSYFEQASMLGLSAWLRIALVLPVCALLWLGVWWALDGVPA